MRPEELSGIPESVVEVLESKKCVIPQTYDSYRVRKVTTNVFQGEIASEGQRDWVALCSVGSAAHITVVWGGDVRCDGEVLADRSRLDNREVIQTIQVGDRTVEHFVRQIEFRPARSEDRSGHGAVLERRGEQRVLVHSCIDGDWQQRELVH